MDTMQNKIKIRLISFFIFFTLLYLKVFKKDRSFLNKMVKNVIFLLAKAKIKEMIFSN
jgi:hypothetical protein